MLKLNDIQSEILNLSQRVKKTTFENEIKVYKFSNNELRKDSIVYLAGPWVGELGVALIRWIPYLRWLKQNNQNVYFIAGSYENFMYLYSDFVDEYWVLPEKYANIFLNRETSYNYGTFHELLENISYREHATRKRFTIPFEEHCLIALSWLKKIEKRDFLAVKLIVSLANEGRIFFYYTATTNLKIKAIKMLQEKDIDLKKDKIICILPRLRKLQPERSWTVAFYKNLLNKISSEIQNIAIIVLGSQNHEYPLQYFVGNGKVINIVGETNSLDLQIAFWNLADAATGPLSGGLVMGYLLKIPLIHWYKPDQFPKRKGIPWNLEAEKDYSAVRGIVSSWIQVEDSNKGIQSVIQTISLIKKR